MQKLQRFWLNGVATIERTHIPTHIMPNLGNTLNKYFVVIDKETLGYYFGSIA